MKKLNILIIASFLLTSVFSLNAQNDKSKRPSPPRTATGTVGDVEVVIDYGAPSVKGRTIFGDGSKSLETYGKVWRTGANEATTFSVSKDVTINGEALPAGKYGLFTIPGENEWTVIFNKTPNQWGAYDYDSDQDALRIKVTPGKLDGVQEQLMFNVNENGQVAFAWEYVTFDFMVSGK